MMRNENATHDQPRPGAGSLPAITAPLWRHAADRPAARALIDERVALTWSELVTAIEKQIAQFRADGITAGSPVLVLFDVCVESIIAYWALHGIGAVIIVGDPGARKADIDHYLRVTGANHVLAGMRAQQEAPIPPGLTVHRLDRPHSASPGIWQAAAGQSDSRFENTVTLPRGCGVVLFSSGTTGKPKAIAHSRDAIAALHETLLKTWKLSSRDTVLGALPFHTIYGLIFSAGSTIYAGAALLLRERFHPEHALRAIEQHKVTTAAFVPAMIIMMLNLERNDRFDCASLRMVYSASAPISEADIDRFSEFAGAAVICNFGMTEIPGAAVEVAGSPHVRGSAGKVSPGFEVSIRNEKGEPLPVGTVGEIAMRGPTAMIEYLGAPEMTAERVRDGWVYSQDRGKLDDEGNVHVVGRMSEMIIRGGLNISPLEIENTLSSHVAVGDVAVAGVPDAVLGQIVSAFVVPRKDVPAMELEETLKQHCSAHLSPPKVPAEFFMIEEIPRNAAGKINRKALLASREILLGRT